MKVPSTADVDTLMNALAKHLKYIDFWQCYFLDVKTEREKAKVALLTNEAIPRDGPDVAGKTVVELFEILRDSGKVIGYHGLAGRFSTEVGDPRIRQSVKTTEVQEGSLNKYCGHRTRAFDVLNVSLYEEWNADNRVALDSVENCLNCTRLDDHGPKLVPISERCVPSHFGGSFR